MAEDNASEQKATKKCNAPIKYLPWLDQFPTPIKYSLVYSVKLWGQQIEVKWSLN